MKGAGGGNYRIVVGNGNSKGASNQNHNRRPAPSRNWKEEAKQSSILGNRGNNDGQKLDGSAWMASRREKLKEQEAEERRRQAEMKEKQAEEARQRRHSQMAALKQVVAKADASNSSLQEVGKSGSHQKIPGLDDEEVSHDGSHKSHGSHWSKNSRGSHSAGGGARSDSWRRGMAPPGKDHTHRPKILQKPPASPKAHRKGNHVSPMASPKQPTKTMATSSGVVGRHVITTGEGTKVEYKGGGSSLAMAVSHLKEGNKHHSKQNHPKPTIQRLSDGSVRISKDGGNRQPKGPSKKNGPETKVKEEKQTSESKALATQEEKEGSLTTSDAAGSEEKMVVDRELSESQEIETQSKNDSKTPNIDEEESSVGGRSFNSAGGRSNKGRGGRGRSGRGGRGSGRGRDSSGRGRGSSGRGRDGRDGSGRGRESSGRGRGSARGKGKSNYRAPRPAGPNAKSHSYHIEIGAKPS